MLFTIENWGNLQLLIDFRWLKFAKCHMTHPTVQRHGDFQSQMAIAVQLKQKRKKKTLPKQEWGVVQVLLLYFHHVSTESVGSGRRVTSTGDSDLFAMQTFFVFFQSAKKHVKGAKATTTNVSATTATVKRVTHCAACSSCCCCCQC